MGTVDEVTRRLVHVRYAAAAITEAEYALQDAVRLARAAGATWEQIEEAIRLPDPPLDEPPHDHGPAPPPSVTRTT